MWHMTNFLLNIIYEITEAENIRNIFVKTVGLIYAQ